MLKKLEDLKLDFEVKIVGIKELKGVQTNRTLRREIKRADMVFCEKDVYNLLVCKCGSLIRKLRLTLYPIDFD